MRYLYCHHDMTQSQSPDTKWRRVSNIFPLNIDDWVTSSKLLTKLSSLVDWLFNTCLTNFIISNTYFLLSGKLSVNIFLRLLFNINMVLFKAHFSYECQSEWKAQKKLPSTLETQIKYRQILRPVRDWAGGVSTWHTQR